MINAEEIKKIHEQAKENLKKLMEAQDQVLKMVNKENPELFTDISRDLNTLKTSKDLTEIQKILNNYADKYNKHNV